LVDAPVPAGRDRWPARRPVLQRSWAVGLADAPPSAVGVEEAAFAAIGMF
jgi:hypothetical protein